MHPLEIYYLNQAGRGVTPSEGIGPVYAAPLYLQRGYCIGHFLAVCFEGPTHTVAQGQSCGSRDVAYRREDPNRHFIEQVTRAEPQGY